MRVVLNAHAYSGPAAPLVATAPARALSTTGGAAGLKHRCEQQGAGRRYPTENSGTGSPPGLGCPLHLAAARWAHLLTKPQLQLGSQAAARQAAAPSRAVVLESRPGIGRRRAAVLPAGRRAPLQGRGRSSQPLVKLHKAAAASASAGEALVAHQLSRASLAAFHAADRG